MPNDKFLRSVSATISVYEDYITFSCDDPTVLLLLRKAFPQQVEKISAAAVRVPLEIQVQQPSVFEAIFGKS